MEKQVDMPYFWTRHSISYLDERLILMKISVITPTYNRAAYIVETVESVLGQTHDDIEYLVLDDGSKDDTGLRLAPYKNRLIYHRHDNMGETRTVNKGYAMATGDAVVVVNSDDPLHRPDALALLSKALEDNPEALAAYPDYVYIDTDGNIIKFQPQIDFDLLNMVETFNITLGPGMCIKLDALRAIGLRNEKLKYTGDVDVSVRLAGRGKLVHVAEPLATHRLHSEAASTAARGGVMADEVYGLMHTALSFPPYARLSQREKQVYYRRISREVMTYCRKYSAAYFKYLLRSYGLFL